MINGTSLKPLYLTGMSSGLDTQSIVDSLLQIDKLKVDKQYKLKTTLEWKNEALRGVNLTLRNFREKNLSVLSEFNMMSSKPYRVYKTTVLTDTNAVKIDAGNNASALEMTIDSITQLAKAAQLSSQNVFDGNISFDTALKDLPFQNELVFEDGEISFSINGEVFTFTEDSTLNQIISKINANSNTGVTINYSSLKKGFTFTSKTTGASSQIELINLKGNAFAQGNTAFGIEEQTVNGQNAKLSIDSIAVERETNTFTIDGITYTLNNTTNTAVSFRVERDIDTTLNKIVSFIDEYNSLIETLQAKLDEEVFRDYGPLTDEEREQLSDDEAKKWEEKAKSGLLRRDGNISMLLSSMRSAFYTAVGDTGKTPSELGLNTGSYYEKGKITVDKEKLRQAISDNPEEVERLFTSISGSADSSEKFKQSGLVVRISTPSSSIQKTAPTLY